MVPSAAWLLGGIFSVDSKRIGRRARTTGFFLSFASGFAASRIERLGECVNTLLQRRLAIADFLLFKKGMVEELLDRSSKVIAYLFQDEANVKGLHGREHDNEHCVLCIIG